MKRNCAHWGCKKNGGDSGKKANKPDFKVVVHFPDCKMVPIRRSSVNEIS
jgi:hypothetical protein